MAQALSYLLLFPWTVTFPQRQVPPFPSHLDFPFFQLDAWRNPVLHQVMSTAILHHSLVLTGMGQKRIPHCNTCKSSHFHEVPDHAFLLPWLQNVSPQPVFIFFSAISIDFVEWFLCFHRGGLKFLSPEAQKMQKVRWPQEEQCPGPVTQRMCSEGSAEE